MYIFKNNTEVSYGVSFFKSYASTWGAQQPSAQTKSCTEAQKSDKPQTNKVPPLNTSPWPSLAIFPCHFNFFIVAWTFRSREKFVPSPDFESWISK